MPIRSMAARVWMANAKLGDMVALGNGKFIVIEQGAGPGEKVFNKLILVASRREIYPTAPSAHSVVSGQPA